MIQMARVSPTRKKPPPKMKNSPANELRWRRLIAGKPPKTIARPMVRWMSGKQAKNAVSHDDIVKYREQLKMLFFLRVQCRSKYCTSRCKVALSLASSAVLYFATNAFFCCAVAARTKSPGMIKSVVIKSSDFIKKLRMFRMKELAAIVKI
jgi:hypothetical protein